MHPISGNYIHDIGVSGEKMVVEFTEKISFFSLVQWKEKMSCLKGKKMAVVMSQHALQRWGLQDVWKQLQENNDIVWINRYESNPTADDLCDALTALTGFDAHMILALGGGSTIDLAKGISAFWSRRGKAGKAAELWDAIGMKQYTCNGPPIYAIPTTAGTGSEVTSWASVWSRMDGQKRSIDDVRLLPHEAIIVPELSYTLPPRQILSGGLDAVCHAAEAFWAKHTNPISKELSLYALSLSVRHLKRAIQQPQDWQARKSLCMASLLAGLSFSKTRTTACHAISYPLTAQFGIEHGFAVAMTLAAVARRNLAETPDANRLWEIFGGCEGLRTWLDEVCLVGRVKLRLRDFGVTRAAIAPLAAAFDPTRMGNNPVQFSQVEIEAILNEVYE